MKTQDNLILIGMPGSGKSTIGVLLSKAMVRPFVDVDLLIQQQAGARLHRIIEQEGLDAFLALEEACVLSLSCTETVIATGGSAVYSEQGMRHLAATGVSVYLALSLDTIAARVGDLDARGVARKPGATLHDIYADRVPRYERFADVTVHADGLDHDGVVQAVLQSVERA